MGKWMGRLGSGVLAIVLLSAVGVAAVVGTFLPREQAGRLYGSGWFLGLLLALAVNLVYCLIHRWSFWMERPPSALRHAGFLVLLAAGAVSYFFAERGTLRAELDQDVGAIESDGQVKPLGFEVRLRELSVAYHDPEARLLKVRLPGQDAWHAFPVVPGKSFPVPDSDVTVQVERYVPDFVMDVHTGQVTSRSAEPKNPAIQVKVTGAGDPVHRWVFAQPAGFHRFEGPAELVFQHRETLPKSYQSRVEIRKNGQVLAEGTASVNRPLRYRGWSLYQLRYDPEAWRWSGLLAVRDPGVGVLYAGFGMIALSFLWDFVRRRPACQPARPD